MSSVVVQKYGGSSLSDVGRIRSVAESIVERHRGGARVAVVVSAMGKTTDELMARAASVAKRPPQRELDMLVTAGERISMALLSMAIHELGEDAISFTGSQSGIVTESTHQGAQIIEVRPYRIQEALEKGKIVIVAGYQGVSLDREVTTLGRGGSDTSAVALAAALGADVCEIYSDVDGVYSADPRICPQARLLGELSYEVMQTMAGAGAKVLNANAVEFARRAGIVIECRASGQQDRQYTRIREASSSPPSMVHGVIVAPSVTRVRMGAMDWMAQCEQLASVGARAMRVYWDNERVDAWIDRTDTLGREPALLEAALSAGECEHGAAVSVIGASAYRWQHSALEILRVAGHEPLAMLLGPSDLAFFVSSDSSGDCVRALHNGLIEAAQL